MTNPAHFSQLLAQLHDMSGENVPAEWDAVAWLTEWLDRPQPALGGATASELLGTQEGFLSVQKVLGASVSGAYQ